MEEFNILKDIPEFKNITINKCIKDLSVTLFAENHSTSAVIYNICKLREILKGNSTCETLCDCEYQMEDGRIKIKYDFFDIMQMIFGFKKRSVHKILACEIFLNRDDKGITSSLRKCFKYFSLSKLFELLPLKEKAIEYCQEGYITSDCTVRQLRLKVDELLGKEVVQRDKNLNDFDLNEEYTLNDFKTRWTKTGLIDIAFSLYTNYRGYLLGKKK